MVTTAMIIWTIYHNPSDYPGKWVLRAHFLPGGPSKKCEVVDTLEQARALVPSDYIRMPRYPNDDLAIYETWV